MSFRPHINDYLMAALRSWPVVHRKYLNVLDVLKTVIFQLYKLYVTAFTFIRQPLKGVLLLDCRDPRIQLQDLLTMPVASHLDPVPGAP